MRLCLSVPLLFSNNDGRETLPAAHSKSVRRTPQRSKSLPSRATLRCAVYTRVSTEHGLEQEFNSLDNQREASEAYVKSQAHEGTTRAGS